MKKILVITNEADIHCDSVTQRIREHGGDIIRINSQNYQSNVSFQVNNYKANSIDFDFFISDSEISFSPLDYDTVWYRKPLQIEIKEESENSEILKFRNIEYRVFIGEFYNLNINKRWVNSLYSNEKASYKLSNLEIAKKIGLKVPKTIVTNNPKEAEDFSKLCNWEIIVKPFKAVGVNYNSFRYSALANKVDSLGFYKFKETVALTPTLLQQYIRKKLELRVTIVGKKVFSAAIYSQENNLTLHDFRGDSAFNLKHSVYHLPKSIENKLLSFNTFHNLLFSTFDIILTPENEYYFLECNPNGQWYWIEELTGLPISDAIAKLLMEN